MFLPSIALTTIFYALHIFHSCCFVSVQYSIKPMSHHLADPLFTGPLRALPAPLDCLTLCPFPATITQKIRTRVRLFHVLCR